MSSTGTKRGRNRGTASSSKGDQTYKKGTKNSQKISKYFIKAAKDESGELSDSPYKNCLNEVKGVRLDNSMSDFDDFSTPKTINKVSKIAAKAPGKNVGKKRARQAPLTMFIEDNLKHSDVNPEHLQMALALSESSYQAENPMPSSQEKKESFKKALEKFGFGYSKSRISVQAKREPPEPKRKKSRYRYVTPILNIRTREEREALISSKVSLILSENCRKSSSTPPLTTELLIDSLRKYSNRKLFRLHSLELDQLNTGDLFYVRGLCIEACSASCGRLLRDWRRIPGRDPTPERPETVKIGVSDSMVFDDKCGRSLTPEGGVSEANMIRTPDKSPMLYSESFFEDKSVSETFPKVDNNEIREEKTDIWDLDDQSINNCGDSFFRNWKVGEEEFVTVKEPQKLSKYKLSPTRLSLQLEEEFPSEINCFKTTSPNKNILTCVAKNVTSKNGEDSLKYEHIDLCSSDEDVKDTEFHGVQDTTLEYSFSSKMTSPRGFDLVHSKKLIEIQKSPKLTLVTSPTNKTEIIGGERSTNKNTSFVINSPTPRKSETNNTISGNFITEDLPSDSVYLKNDLCSSGIFQDHRLSPEISCPRLKNLSSLTPPRNVNLICPTSPNKRSFSCRSPDLFGSDQESPVVTRFRREIAEEMECYDLTQSDQEESFRLLSGPEDSMDRRSDLNVTDYVKNLLSEAPARKLEKISTSDDDSQPSQSSVCITDDELNYSSVFSAPNRNDESSEEEQMHVELISPPRKTTKRIPLSNISPRKVSTNLENSSIQGLSHVPVDTPSTSQGSFVIKTKNVTPMANYDEMDTPRIVRELDKFGLKPLRRQKGAKLLKYIYEATHPVVDENTHVGKKRRTQEFHVGEIIVGDILDEEVILEKKQSKRIFSCAVPLHIAWHNLVMSNPKIRENILLYEPLQLEVLHSMLKDQGFKFDIQDLLAFLDKKCVTIRTAQGQHHGKKQK